MKEYHIEISMTPHPWDSPAEPYFWMIAGNTGGSEWFNDGFGWAVSPEQAWIDANEYYQKYKINKEK